ncbi:18152_t:CDS:2 [Funneliformis geosporum]|nr:18152_t:CDS:2 [Funneliformis geosporum]
MIAHFIADFVGERGLSFSPQNVSAKLNDVIQWEYIYGKHQIVQSDGPGNCIKSKALNAFDSGLKEQGIFSMTITQTKGMMYYFCSYSSHCAYGMWGVIKIDPNNPVNNPTESSTPNTATPPNKTDTNDPEGMNLPIIIGISIGGFFALSILGLVGFVLYRRKKYQKQFDISMQPYDPKLIAGEHGGTDGGSNLNNIRGSVGMASVSSLGNNLSRSNTRFGHSTNEVIASNIYNQNQPYDETAMNYVERTSSEFDGGSRLYGGPLVGDNESNSGEVPISSLSPPPTYDQQYGQYSNEISYQQGPPIPPHPSLIPQQQYGVPYLVPQPTNIYPQYGPQYNNTSDIYGPSNPGQYAYQQPPPHQPQQSGQFTVNPAQYYGSRILYKFGWLIGYWAGNKPINGSFLNIKFDSYKSSIIAWRITAINKSLRSVSWSKNLSVRLVYTEPEYRHQILFSVQYDSKQHRSKVLEGNNILNDDGECIIRKALFEKHNESVLWKQDDDDEYGDEQRGLILEEEEISNADEVDTTIFCHENTIENQDCFLFEDEKYFKCWTLNKNQKEKKKFDGIWIGDYGAHGIEFILFREDDSGYLFATKITGDINVPRGEISWRCNLKDQVRICDELEWNGKVSYRAKTKVAYEGFRNPDEIDSEVIIVSYDKLVVYWYDLSEMATFVRVV